MQGFVVGCDVFVMASSTIYFHLKATGEDDVMIETILRKDIILASHRKNVSISSDAFTATSGAFHRQGPGGSFIQESFHSSTDYPTYIAWQTLSTDLSEKIRQGSLRLNRANTLEYASITEEAGERSPLLHGRQTEKLSGSSISTPAVQQGIAWTVAAFLMVNTALGAGVLNYPAAYDRAGGIVSATIMQIAMMIMVGGTMLVLGYCSDLNNDNTYHDVLMSTCGKRAQQMAAGSILLSCYIICITFFIIIGDQYDRLFLSVYGADFCHNWYMNRRFTILVTALVFVMPLCYFQRLDFLKYASSLGIFVMLYPVFLTIYAYSKGTNEQVEMKTRPTSFIDVVVTMPVICFAYQAHEVVITIYSNLRDRRLANLTKCTVICMLFMFVVYCLIGTFGYLTYGSNVKPDIMQMFDASDPWVVFGITALIVKMVTTYPLLIFCGRGAFDGMYAEAMKLSADDYIHGERRRRLAITTGWFTTSLALSVVISSIGVVLELLGCLAAANVFIFPGMCLIGMAYKKDKFRLKHVKLIFCAGAVMTTFGVLIFGLVFVQSVKEYMETGGTHHLLCK
ncbi:sodium-coupled neutral amino acid transporter 7-like [Ornithodoros turicata]|uniref:sodium-coupled neutral amino acid transporter 7-like n=1 Tax=Ornithodoros turicata TaxID=34597 RepID=UPI00313A3BAD